jgi:hypothetical protein
MPLSMLQWQLHKKTLPHVTKPKLGVARGARRRVLDWWSRLS